MLIVPLQPVPNQAVTVNLADQVVQIDLETKQRWLYMRVWVNDGLIIRGVIAQNLNRIVRSAYLGFKGDFVFWDTEGDTDPVFTGLGTRYKLVYVTAGELATWQATAAAA